MRKSKSKAKPSVRTIEERNSIVEENLHLATWVVRRMSGMLPTAGAVSEADRISVATVAMIRAAELWNPEKSKFSTYATNIMMRHLRRAIETGLENCIRIPPDVARKMHPQDLKRLWCRPIPETWDAGGPIPSPDEEAHRRERNKLLREAIGKLAWPRRQVVARVYLEGKTVAEVAAEMPFSTQRTRQILESGLSHLRKILEKSSEELLQATE